MLTWSRQNQCDGREIERIQEGCLQLLNLRDAGQHKVQPCWGTEAPAPRPDGILASILLMVLQASPDVFEPYLKLDPHYIHRLIRTQHSPRHLLRQYLQSRHFGQENDQPVQKQLQAALNEIKQRQNEQIRIEALIEQHNDQQRRTRRLITNFIKSQS